MGWSRIAASHELDQTSPKSLPVESHRPVGGRTASSIRRVPIAASPAVNSVSPKLTLHGSAPQVIDSDGLIR